MSDFDKAVMSFIPVLHDEAAQTVLEQQEQARQAAFKKEQETARLERARAIGRQAADMLSRQGVPKIPVLVRNESSTSLSSEWSHVADAWHVFYTMHYEHYTESNHPQNYALRTDGSLEQFGYGDATRPMRRIHNPEPIFPKFECEYIENEGFKKAVAGLIAGFGVSEYRHL